MARKELLVLGNGFDLQCGLKSRYSDFEKPRLAKLDTFDQQQAGRPEDWFHDQMLTLWDLILRADQPITTWYDLEASIARWVKRRLNYTDMNFKSTFLDPVVKQRYEVTPFWDWPDVESSIGDYAFHKYMWDGSSQALSSILLKELNVYETEFTRYMNSQITAHRSYYETAQKLIEALGNDRPSIAKQHRDVPDTQEPQDKWLHYSQSAKSYGSRASGLTILDFNFTEPLKTLRDRFPLSVNIHGNLTDDNVIFGIDGTNFDMSNPENSATVRFTKTYRLMQLRTEGYAPIVSPPDSQHPALDTDTIKFYGHSLGSADYAYFQSIFDTIDLYGGKTHLIFYYHDEAYAQDMYGKVNRLINTYGKTLDNQNHGKNLLHKLLLEGRLNVILGPAEWASVRGRAGDDHQQS